MKRSGKEQGNIGEAAAIFHYVRKGYTISKPLFENSPYDFIVDDGVTLLRIQVKTSKFRVPSGKYEVNLRVFGGNRTGTGKVKKISSSEVDVVFVLLPDGRTFELIAKELDGKSRIHIG